MIAKLALELEQLDVHAWSEIFRECAAVDPALWDVWRDALERSIDFKFPWESSSAAYRRRLTEAMLSVCLRNPALAERIAQRR